MMRRFTHRLWIGVLAEIICLSLMSRHGDFLEAGEGSKFVRWALAASGAFWLADLGLQEHPRTAGVRTGWFWVVAIVLRLVMLPTCPGDDLWRYRWEGMIQLHGFNPYQLAPDSPLLAGLRDADWMRINHRDLPAIYPPLAELTFAGLARMGNAVLGDKLLFAGADLAVAGVLRRLLVRSGQPPERAAWYAWNPLVVYVSAGAAHFDVLMVLAMLGAVWSLDRFSVASMREDRPSPWRVTPDAWISVGLLGIAVAIKAVPLVLLPTWFFALGWRRALLALPVAFGITPALATFYGFPGVPVFGMLSRFVQGFRVDDAFWWLVDPAGRFGGLCGTVATVVCLALAIRFRRDWRRGTLWVLGAGLLLGPAVHAWYLLWVLPLAVWRGDGARAWLVFSVSVFGYFFLWEINHASGCPWEEPLWLRLLIYLPPTLTWAWTLIREWRQRADRANQCYP